MSDVEDNRIGRQEEGNEDVYSEREEGGDEREEEPVPEQVVAVDPESVFLRPSGVVIKKEPFLALIDEVNRKKALGKVIDVNFVCGTGKLAPIKVLHFDSDGSDHIVCMIVPKDEDQGVGAAGGPVRND